VSSSQPPSPPSSSTLPASTSLVCRHCGAICEQNAAGGSRFCGSCGGSLERATGGEADAWLGRVVDRRYRVLAQLGAGGMGVVYRVEHLQLGKIAAMKVLHADGAKDKEIVRRFRLEAQAVSQLNHQNIVQTFDFGQWDGALYLIMEYVKGEDMGAIIAREGPMPFRRAAKLFIQVCSALTEAHEAGIIHRDLKPENLMCIRRRDGSEHAKVLDFGLAKLRERDDAAAISTVGQVVGTPYYMAPEQVRAEPLDPRSDVYSLGATLYRVVTGLPPFQASSPMAVLSKHLTEEVILPTARVPDLDLPLEMDEIVARAMAKSVDDRYASAADIQLAFERALERVTSAAARGADGSTSGLQASGVSAWSRTPAAASSDDSSDLADGGQRLRRQDLDDFEGSLRRRRIQRSLVVPAVLLALAVGVGALYLRANAPKITTAEREPNNTPGYANLIASDVAVTGSIGKMLEGGHPDLDYFQVPAGGGQRVLSARLEGIPDMDLVLELYDGQGRRLAKADAHGVGWGEWLQPISIGPAEAYLLVRQVWIEGTVPKENVADRYTLTAHFGPPEAGWEVEPNDWEASATPVAVGQSIRGYLGSAEDRDWFALTPAVGGRLKGRVSAPAGVDLVLLYGDGNQSPTNRQGPGQEEEFSLPALAGQPILIGVTRKAAAEGDPKAGAISGLDEPYELRSQLEPGK
jgi:serine/threonine protein kinase